MRRDWIYNVAWENDNGDAFRFDAEYSIDGGRLGSPDPADQPEIEILQVDVLDTPVHESGVPWTKEEAREYLMDQLAHGGELHDLLTDLAYEDAGID